MGQKQTAAGLNDHEKRAVIHWFMTLFYVLVDSMKNPDNSKRFLNFKDIREFAKMDWRQFYGDFKPYFDNLWAAIEKLDDVSITKSGGNLQINIRLAYLTSNEKEQKKIANGKTVYKLSESVVENVEHQNPLQQSETESETSIQHETNSFEFTAVETPFDEDITRYLKDLDNGYNKNEFDFERARLDIRMTNPADESRQDSFEFIEPEEDNDYKIRREQQKQRHQEEMKEKEQERAQRRAEFQREMQKVREQNRQRFLMFFECIALKMRFEDKEKEIAKWIEKECRDPIRKLLSYWMGMSSCVLQDNIRDFNCQCELLMDTLNSNFEGLSETSQQVPDKMFIKVIQKSLCNVATKLNNIMDNLENIMNSESPITNAKTLLNKLMSTLSPFDIPGTSEIRKICKENCDESEWEGITFPERARQCFVEIQEEVENELNTEGKEEEPEETANQESEIGNTEEYVGDPQSLEDKRMNVESEAEITENQLNGTEKSVETQETANQESINVEDVEEPQSPEDHQISEESQGPVISESSSVNQNLEIDLEMQSPQELISNHIKIREENCDESELEEAKITENQLNGTEKSEETEGTVNQESEIGNTEEYVGEPQSTEDKRMIVESEAKITENQLNEAEDKTIKTQEAVKQESIIVEDVEEPQSPEDHQISEESQGPVISESSSVNQNLETVLEMQSTQELMINSKEIQSIISIPVTTENCETQFKGVPNFTEPLDNPEASNQSFKPDSEAKIEAKSEAETETSSDIPEDPQNSKNWYADVFLYQMNEKWNEHVLSKTEEITGTDSQCPNKKDDLETQGLQRKMSNQSLPIDDIGVHSVEDKAEAPSSIENVERSEDILTEEPVPLLDAQAENNFEDARIVYDVVHHLLNIICDPMESHCLLGASKESGSRSESSAVDVNRKQKEADRARRKCRSEGNQSDRKLLSSYLSLECEI